MPLAFAVAVIVSLAAPERDGDARFAAVERQMHLGTE